MPKRHEPPIGYVVRARAEARANKKSDRRDRDRPSPPPAPPLSHFAGINIPVRVECEACRRKLDKPAGEWIALFGDVTLKRVERLARCSACGERELIDARPLYEKRAPR